MIKNIVILSILILISSCSYIAGPEGMFPSKEYDFLYERIEEDISCSAEISEDMDFAIILS